MKNQNIKVVLFDADGVLTLPEEVFSVLYTKSHGLDIKPFEDFFKTQWTPIVTGKKDLKESISEHLDLWQWSGTPDELLELWFKSEDIRNNDLIELIPRIRTRGIQCFLATDQEYYRGEYMKNVMFKDIFDGHFISAELGVTKTDPRFFEIIIDTLREDDRTLEPNNIFFFDDSRSKVETAKVVGLDAHLYESVSQIENLLLD